MNVWFCIPSKRPPAQAEAVLKLWRERGYKIALFCDSREDAALKHKDYYICGDYTGYSIATNALVLQAARYDADARWFVLGGDDVEPDLNHSAEEIAAQCEQRFGGTFGVMQPTGDRWGDTPHSRAQFGEHRGAYADRVCGSPWIGREFCLRINQGRGPLWPGFGHMFEDECLQAVATKLGVLWQRRDLTHYHRHWARERGRVEDMPEFLKYVNSPEHWRESKAEFDRLKASDFAECMPLI